MLDVLPWTVAENGLTLEWSAGRRTFREVVRFPAALPRAEWVDAVIDVLACVAAVSYAKAFAPAVVSAGGIRLTEAGRALVESALSEGMAEFSFQNGIVEPVVFLGHDEPRPSVESPIFTAVAPLIPLGGGRDSAVVACALSGMNATLMSIGRGAAARNVASALGRDIVVVDREIDGQIAEMNAAGAPNGHIPITAITMLVSVLCAAALGCDAVVMANEASSSAPTRVVDGVAVNHQHSKSSAFETALHQMLVSVGSRVACFSVLRDRDDTDISRVFATKCASVHQAVVSCNRAGVRDATRRSERWCGNCAKCRSVFLSLAPHMSPNDLMSMFGVDLLADAAHTAGFAELLDDDTKPFECVQTTEEARAALGALVESPDWSSHAVVSALAGRGASRLTRTPEGLSAHVPETMRTAMREFFS